MSAEEEESPGAVFQKSVESHYNDGDDSTPLAPTPVVTPHDSTLSGARLARIQAKEMAQEQARSPVDEDDEIKDEEQMKDEHDLKAKGGLFGGDDEFDGEEEIGDATWGEVFQTCCVHTPQEWLWIGVGIFFCVFFLYWFLFGLELLGSGAKVMSACGAGSLFGEDTNPVAGVMVGILATVLLQSSSTTTSIVVSLVGDDEGSGTISVSQGIYMVMGANIGTSVTNTIVAMGHIGDSDQLERAFAGATVHDMFNFMNVALLFPIEVATGFLDALTGAMVKNAEPDDGEKWEGPIKKIVSPLGDRVIIPNKSVSKGIATGDKECSDFYPMNCGPGTPTYKSCGGEFGLIACDSDTNNCPGFFSKDATEQDDKVSGGVVFFIAIIILFGCLMALVAVLQKLLLGMSTRIIFKATNVNGYISIAIGAGITVLVQSSSITTSTLTPLVGMGAIRLEQMYPLTLGANIGTTVTGLTAALVSDNIESLQVALAHLCFNVIGIMIFYPIPFMRGLPVYGARQLGKLTRLWRGFPILYIATMFIGVPLVFLGLSAVFQQDEKGYTVLGSFLVIIISVAILYAIYWCSCLNGKETCIACMHQRERRRVTMHNLPDDMDYVLAKLSQLIEHTGLPEDEGEDEDLLGEEDEFTDA